jgi:hypothetical protein
MLIPYGHVDPPASFAILWQLVLAYLQFAKKVCVRELSALQRLLEHADERTPQRAIALLNEVEPALRELPEAEHE